MKHVTKKLQAFVAGELSGAERQMVSDPLGQCPACAAQEVETRQLWDLLGEATAPSFDQSDSAWPEIQARTFGRQEGTLLYGGGLWSKAGIAGAALAAGLALAILLPGNGAADKALADESGASWGSSFWLDEQSDAGLSEMWLALADEGSDS